MLLRIGTVLLVLAAIACASSEAYAGKVGPEFQVAGGADPVSSPSVAALSDGGFVVIWSLFIYDTGNGPETQPEFRLKLYGVRGQRYNAVGAPVGQGIQIVQETSYSDTTNQSMFSGEENQISGADRGRDVADVDQ